MASMPQSKDTEQQTGLKKKQAQLYVVYKRLISLKNNQYWLRVKGWKKVFQTSEPHK
jgi:hypothetical protein